MIVIAKGVSEPSVEGFSRLFDATAAAFEREAARLSRDIVSVAPERATQRERGKQG